MEHKIVQHLHSATLDNAIDNSTTINSATTNSWTSKSAL